MEEKSTERASNVQNEKNWKKNDAETAKTRTGCYTNWSDKEDATHMSISPLTENLRSMYPGLPPPPPEYLSTEPEYLHIIL